MGCLMNFIIGLLIFIGLLALMVAIPPIGVLLFIVLLIYMVAKIME